MGKGITLSPKHGVNPSLGLCFYCQKAKEVMLMGHLPADAEAPRQAVFNMEPCDECAGLMKRGVILISIDPALSEDDQTNPYRTGGWCVVRADTVERWRSHINGDVVNHMLEKRFAFMEDQVWDIIGLPRGPVEGVPSA